MNLANQTSTQVSKQGSINNSQHKDILRTTLYANSVFSTVSAGFLLLVPGLIARRFIDMPISLLLLSGAILLMFAAVVFVVAKAQRINKVLVRLIFFADLGWVVLTPLALFFFSSYISALGNILLLSVALMVALLAWFEWSALNQRA